MQHDQATIREENPFLDYLAILEQAIEHRAISFAWNTEVEPPQLRQVFFLVVWGDVLEEINVVCMWKIIPCVYGPVHAAAPSQPTVAEGHRKFKQSETREFTLRCFSQSPKQEQHAEHSACRWHARLVIPLTAWNTETLTVCMELCELVCTARARPVHCQLVREPVVVYQTVRKPDAVRPHGIASSISVVAYVLIIEVGHDLVGFHHLHDLVQNGIGLRNLRPFGAQPRCSRASRWSQARCR